MRILLFQSIEKKHPLYLHASPVNCTPGKFKGSAIRTMPQFFSALCPNSYSYYAVMFFMITSNI